MSTTPPPGYSRNPYADPHAEPYAEPTPYGEQNPYARATQQPYPGVVPPPQGPRRSSRRGAMAAAVVATSLVVGGAAGLGGAAAWDLFDEDGAAPVPTSQTARVADQDRTRAADGTVESVAALVLPSVVKIDVRVGQSGGSGSGIILTEDGTILTNNHVVESALSDGTIRVSFSDGTTAEAEILGTDPLTDTAVIKAKDVSGLTPARIGRSADLAVGQDVVAIGSPFGLDATVTSGIVSALDRPVNVGSDEEGNSTTYPAIQTDAAINPGNSGGPLVDATGAVVGINSSIRTAPSQSPFGSASTGGSIGLGFAIPIDEVMPVVEQMIAGETPTHARLGISVSDTADGTPGSIVQEVSPGSTAAEAGLRSGDVVIRIDDRPVAGADSLVAIIRSYRPGDTVELTWLRNGEEKTASVVLDSDGEDG